MANQKLGMLAIVAMALLFIGSADAWCKAGYKSCNSNQPEGCETCVATDVNNCGDCGKKCPVYPNSTPTCSNGWCGSYCNWGWKDCNNNLQKDGCEVYVESDVNNCGWCGNKCPGAPYAYAQCSGGKCSLVCDSGWANCDNNWGNGCETDTGNDVNNCGWCGNKCVQPTYYGGETVCSNGKCVEQCKNGMKYDYNKKCCV